MARTHDHTKKNIYIYILDVRVYTYILAYRWNSHTIVKVAVRRALKFFFEFDVNVNGLAAERLQLCGALFKPLPRSAREKIV